MAHESKELENFHIGELVGSLASVLQATQAQRAALTPRAGLVKTGDREEPAPGQKPRGVPAASALPEP